MFFFYFSFQILLQNPYLSGELYSLVLNNYNSLSSSPGGLTGTEMLNQVGPTLV